jgi:hypothetical protein
MAIRERSTKAMALAAAWLVGFTPQLATTQALAQTAELLTPLPANKDASPAQAKAIDSLRSRPTTQSIELVNVNLNALLKADRARVDVPAVAAMSIARQSADVRSATDFVWHGVLSEVPGQATLVARGGNVTGSIQDRGALYRIEPVGNGTHALIKVDTSKLPLDHPASFQDRQQASAAPLPPPPVATGDAMVEIDIMVPYTTAAKEAVPDIVATVQLAVAEANQSYLNSGVRMKLRLVDTFELSYSEAGKDFDTVLADFSSNTTVRNLREASGADLAVMIIDKADYCGLASAIMANATNAFALVHFDCATGYYSFAHEIGHLMGARHDEKGDPSNSPFAHGHGYQHPSSDPAKRFRTVMGYACSGPMSCDPRIPYWSNPNVTYSGIPTGTSSTNDNARVLNATSGTIASFRPPRP